MAWTTKNTGDTIAASHINDLQTGKVDSDGTASPTFIGATLFNNADADFLGALTIRSGLTANYRAYIHWKAFNTQTIWQMGKNAAGDFILQQSPDAHHYMVCYHSVDGSLYLTSRGSGQVIVNGYSTEGSTGGLGIYNGGATPAKIIDFAPASAQFMTVQGFAVSPSQYALRVTTNHNAAISGSAAVSFRGISSGISYSSTSNTTGSIAVRGGEFAPQWTGNITACGAASTLIGFSVYPQITGTGTLPTIIGVNVSGPYINNAGLTVTNYYGVMIANPEVTAGTLSNAFGLFITEPTTGVVNYAFYVGGGKSVFQGNVGIGTATFGTSATRELIMKTAAAPAGNVADCFQLYSDDQTAGNACPHVRTENGRIVKVYQVVDARIDDVITESEWDATNAGVLDAIRDALIANGMMAAA